ncbi:MAG: radical SAM protein, partial [Victivallales bacterium]|nr:radical SAM protein [Victivallales bacterium]
MKKSKFITGLAKLLFYARMSIVCALRYHSFSVLWKASKFTSIFFKHKLVRLPSGEYKLDFYMPRYPSEAFFTAIEDKVLHKPPRPVSVVLSISKACAYHCPHCYQRKDSPQELPLPILLENVRKLRDFGVVAWAVEGGEPLLRMERLEAVLSEISGLEVWVNSTGHSATPEKIRRLAELKVTGVMSSIHSVNPDEHDAFTGIKGSWRRALDFLHDCQEVGMLIGFNTVLTDEQIVSGGIDEIMSLAKEHNCDYIQLIHPKACGGWMGKSFDTALSQKAIRIAKKAQLRYNSSSEPNSPVLTAQVFEESPEMLGCCCGGIDRFYIGASGEVQPCEF